MFHGLLCNDVFRIVHQNSAIRSFNLCAMEKNIEAHLLHTVVVHVAIRLKLTDSKAPGLLIDTKLLLLDFTGSNISTGLTSGFCFQVDFCYSCLRE